MRSTTSGTADRPVAALEPGERQKGILFDAGVLAVGTVVGNGTVLVLTPVVARLYSPESVGLAASFSAFVSYTGLAVTLRYDMAVASAASTQKATRLFFASLLLAPFTSAVFTGLFLVLRRAQLFGYERFPLWTAVLAFIALCSIGSLAAARCWLVRLGLFRDIAYATAAQGVARGMFQVGLAAISRTWASLVCAEVLSRALALLPLRGRVAASFSARPSPKGAQAELAAESGFAGIALLSTMLDALAAAAVIPLALEYWGAHAAGQVAMAVTITAAPVGLVVTTMADAFHGRAATYSSQDPAALSRLFSRTAGLLALGGVGPAIIVALTGEAMLQTLLGNSWVTASSLVVIMVPWMFAQLIVSPLSRVVFLRRRQKLKLVYDLTSLTAVFAVLSFAWKAGASVEQAVLMLSCAKTLAYTLYFLLLVWIVGSEASNPSDPAVEVARLAAEDI